MKAWIVKQAFEDYASGMSTVDIAKHLNSLGARTLRSNGDFKSINIELILGNECYVGDRLLQKRAPKNYLTHRPDDSQAYDSRYITNDHEGIVSRELWDKVQTMRQIHREQMNAGIYIKKSCYPLYGKVFCGTCGRPCCRRTVRNHDGSKEATWVCVDRFKGKKGNGCMNPIAKERYILKAMKEKVGSENPALVKKIVLKEDYKINVSAL